MGGIILVQTISKDSFTAIAWKLKGLNARNSKKWTIAHFI